MCTQFQVAYGSGLAAGTAVGAQPFAEELFELFAAANVSAPVSLARSRYHVEENALGGFLECRHELRTGFGRAGD